MSKVDPQHVEIIVNVLGMGLGLVCKKGIFGGLKPTKGQLGYCFGFCDAVSQQAGHDLVAGIAFITIVFTRLFGKKGGEYVREVMDNQHSFLESIMEGGNAFLSWGRDGTPPIPPSS